MRSPWRTLGYVLGLASVGALTWFVLRRPTPPSRWCALEASPEAVIGRNFDLRIRVLEPVPETRLMADLHWATKRHVPQRSLLGDPVALTPESDGTFRVSFAIPPRDDLGFVQAVLYLSPDGDWRTRVRAAGSAVLAVKPAGSGGADTILRPLVVTDEDRAGKEPPPDSWIVRVLIAGFCATGAAACWRHRAQRGAMALLVGCIAAGIWEVTPVERFLGTALRNFAKDHQFYWQRGFVQLVLTTAIAVVTVAILMRTLRRPHSAGWRLAWLAFWTYAGLSLAGFLSLHALDSLLRIPVAGITCGQLAQLLASGGIAAGCWLAHEDKRG